MPAPIAPWMSASDALTIWMLSTAMKAPSVAPTTASQVFAETVRAAGTGCGRSLLRVEAALMVYGSAIMGISLRLAERALAAVRPHRQWVRDELAGGLAFGNHRRLGVDGRFRRHARTQQTFEVVVVEHDLHRHPLHDFGEIAGGVDGRQQREFQAAGRRQAVDMAFQPGRMETVDHNFDRLAAADIGKLGLLEVRHDIDRVERNDRHQLRSGLHELTDPERAR